MLYPQMKTSDGDGQNVSYAISHDDGLQFSIDSATGIIKQTVVIDREKVQQIRLEVQATDDGNNRNSIICIICIAKSFEHPVFHNDQFI